MDGKRHVRLDVSGTEIATESAELAGPRLPAEKLIAPGDPETALSLQESAGVGSRGVGSNAGRANTDGVGSRSSHDIGSPTNLDMPLNLRGVESRISSELLPQPSALPSELHGRHGGRRKDSLSSDVICWSNPLSSRGSIGSLNVLPSVDEARPPKCRERVDTALNQSIAWAGIVGLLTVWALYADDLNRLLLPKEADLPFSILNWIILGIFVAEFALCATVEKGYVFSLQGFMDMLAVASLVPFEDILRGISEAAGDISVARVARATRALRILRATRATLMALKSQKQFRNVNQRRVGASDEKASVLEETLVSRTNLGMLLGVLVLLVGTSFMEYTEMDRTARSGLEMLDQTYYNFHIAGIGANNGTGEASHWELLLNTYIKEVESGTDVREIVLLIVGGQAFVDDADERDLLRADELVDYEATTGTLVEVSLKRMRQTEAAYSIALTTFTVLVILAWTTKFSRDHKQLVLDPVHRMIQLLRTMSKDPRLAIRNSEDRMRQSDREHAVTEMEAIEMCINRFGQLVKVGFGEAGLDVISKNMSLDGGRFDPMIPGTIILGIFGFCDIRNFTDCCEVLQAETMLFTNRIANIVHELVEESGGHVNKNIGDAFLSVWKLRLVEDEQENTGAASYPASRAPSKGSSSNKLGSAQAQASGGIAMVPGLSKPNSFRYRHHLTDAEGVIDHSLRTFIKMQAVMARSRSMQRLTDDPRLKRKLGNDFTVRMGYGLHLGWAVEGAVGSKHKVDATYLSPNVNMASRLEAATKQYSVNILMSHTVYEGMSEELQSECREIDRVTVKGSDQPIGLYVHLPTEAPKLLQEELVEFQRIWAEAFHLYVSGADWSRALKLIAECKEILPHDGPSDVIRGVIEKYSAKTGDVPADWPGFHALTDK